MEEMSPEENDEESPTSSKPVYCVLAILLFTFFFLWFKVASPSSMQTGVASVNVLSTQSPESLRNEIQILFEDDTNEEEDDLSGILIQEALHVEDSDDRDDEPSYFFTNQNELDASVADSDETSDVSDGEFHKEECSLFRAIKSNNMRKLKKLISAECDHAVLVNGRNALHYAAESLNFDATKALIASGLFNINASSRNLKRTPLHIVAIQSGNHESALRVAKLLVEYEANVNSRDSYGYSPIFYAVKELNIELVNFLQLSGADIDIKSYGTNVNIFHYIMNVAQPELQSNFSPIFKSLIDVAFRQDKQYLLTEFNSFNRAPIHEAAAKNCIVGLKELLALNFIDVNTKSRFKLESDPSGLTLYGATPLLFASFNGSVDVVKYLRSRKDISIGKDEGERVPKVYYSKDKLLPTTFERRSRGKSKEKANSL